MMFKIIAFVLLLISCLVADAQTDSTKNNLQRHKELFEQGLITEQEYEMLKKKELNLLNEPAKPSKRDTIKPQQYRSKLIAGGLGFAGGLALVTGGFAIKIKEESGEGSKHSIQEARALFAAGSICGILGIALMTKGARLRNKYFDAQIVGNSVSLRVNF